MELYMECVILDKDKIHQIEKTFLNEGFTTTHKDEDRIAFIKENTYFEYYRDGDGRYMFHLINEEEESNLYTYEYGTIDSKVNQILKKIGVKK